MNYHHYWYLFPLTNTVKWFSDLISRASPHFGYGFSAEKPDLLIFSISLFFLCEKTESEFVLSLWFPPFSSVSSFNSSSNFHRHEILPDRYLSFSCYLCLRETEPNRGRNPETEQHRLLLLLLSLNSKHHSTAKTQASCHGLHPCCPLLSFLLGSDCLTWRQQCFVKVSLLQLEKKFSSQQG